jgi:antitoxin ParD1/3/4
MTSVTVSLPDSVDDWVQSLIATGRYASVSDYVRDLISRDQEAGSDDARWLSDFDASINRGLEDIKAGRGRDAREVFDRLEAKYEALAREREGR